MINLQIHIHKSIKKTFLKVFSIFVYLFICLFVYSVPVSAQSLGLSISPPIDEIMIIPGKEISQTFTITNNGEGGMASIYIIPFRAQGERGNVTLDEKEAITSSSPFASWFSIISPVSTFGTKFYMTAGQSQSVEIRITPPGDAAEKDYYFTLLYELGGDIPLGIAPIGPNNQARIGANLLISLSKDGKPPKTLNIVEFSAPKIIDSLGSLKFNIRLGNYESYYFKPSGEITIKSTFGVPETLKLAPLNVISNSIRNIPCIDGEETITCESGRKVLIGVYKSVIKVSTDEGSTQEKSVTTIAFPFSIIIAIAVMVVTYRIIKKTSKKDVYVLDKKPQ